jgi:hypothetical protein
MQITFLFNYIYIAGLGSQFWRAGMLKLIKRYSFSVFSVSTYKLTVYWFILKLLLLINRSTSALWLIQSSKIVIFLNLLDPDKCCTNLGNVICYISPNLLYSIKSVYSIFRYTKFKSLPKTTNANIYNLSIINYNQG